MGQYLKSGEYFNFLSLYRFVFQFLVLLSVPRVGRTASCLSDLECSTFVTDGHNDEKTN